MTASTGSASMLGNRAVQRIIRCSLIDKTKIGSLMQVKSIAECSKGSILQYIWPALNYNWY